jgi:uncharacterized protein YyaL (SSP411 family)
VLTGEANAATTLALERVVMSRHLPWAVVIPVRSQAAARSLAAALPWVGAMSIEPGVARAYVCDNFTCQAPITEPEELTRSLEAVVAGKRVGQ